jgi:hypothetical protein
MTLVRTDVSEECSASTIRMTRIGELGTMLAVTSNRRKLRRNMSVLTRATRRDIPERLRFGECEGLKPHHDFRDTLYKLHLTNYD